jgi:hypothetical protein
LSSLLAARFRKWQMTNDKCNMTNGKWNLKNDRAIT